jgi:hypothetical protein
MRMSSEGKSSASTRHAGCKIFMAPNGLSGVVVGKEGERAGWLYDFFVAGRAEPRTGYEMMSLACQQGADKLVIYEHPLLAKFFEQFGFQVTNGFRPANWNDIPINWRPEPGSATVPTSCPSFLCMIRIASGFSPANPRGSVARSSPGKGGISAGVPQGVCAHCLHEAEPQRNDVGMFGGYDCPGCGFLYVCGTLTMGPRTDTSS